MNARFESITWNEPLLEDLRALVRLALAEDSRQLGDITTQAIVGADRRGEAHIVAREAGVAAGVEVAAVVLQVAGADAEWTPLLKDDAPLAPGAVVGRLKGSARDLLTCERVILNLLGRLCGVATLTSRYAERIKGTKAEVYDTRKTTPGWRRLEKFAVRCGGGQNHRTGLFDAVLIKDNHLALAGEEGLTPSDAVARARAAEFEAGRPETIIEVEVDTLEQLANVLPAGPDIVLLDNMTNEQLREAIALRDQIAKGVVLEASGGVRLETIGEIAATGVERISVGALTHSAKGLDLGLDWRPA